MVSVHHLVHVSNCWRKGMVLLKCVRCKLEVKVYRHSICDGAIVLQSKTLGCVVRVVLMKS